MAPSRSSSDTHLSEKANEVSSIQFNLFTFQLADCREELNKNAENRYLAGICKKTTSILAWHLD